MKIVGSLRRRVHQGMIRAWSEVRARTVVDSAFPNKPLRRYQTALGTYYLPAKAEGDFIAREMRVGRVFEPEVVELARQYIEPGTTVLDVGSNFGQMAILFAQMVGDGGQVHAFEADDFIYGVLRRNLEANHANNVRAHLAAVHERSGAEAFYPEQDFKRFQSYGSYGIDPNATAGRSVRTLAIDDLHIELPVSFMKVDVQGCDLFALRGATATIRRHRMPILFEYEERFQKEFRTCIQDYLDFVRELGYRVERTVYGINYLILPDSHAVPRTPV